MASTRWATQNEAHGVFEDVFFVSYCFVWAFFFPLIDLLPVSFDFQWEGVFLFCFYLLFKERESVESGWCGGYGRSWGREEKAHSKHVV